MALNMDPAPITELCTAMQRACNLHKRTKQASLIQRHGLATGESMCPESNCKALVIMM